MDIWKAKVIVRGIPIAELTARTVPELHEEFIKWKLKNGYIGNRGDVWLADRKRAKKYKYGHWRD